MPNENWFKLLGGPANGRIIDIPGRPLPEHLRFQVPVTREQFGRQDVVDVEDVIYRLSYIAGSTTEFPVYALDGMDGDAIVERLLQR